MYGQAARTHSREYERTGREKGMSKRAPQPHLLPPFLLTQSPVRRLKLKPLKRPAGEFQPLQRVLEMHGRVCFYFRTSVI